MFVVDTNVLVFAADRDSDAHIQCRRFVEKCRHQSGPWYLTWSVIYEFLRVTTHPRVFRQPWTSQESWRFVVGLTASPSLTILSNGERHAEHLEEILQEIPDVRGNLIHDVHIAAVMKEHGIGVLYTRDADFHRFPFIEVRDPLRT